MTLLLYPIFGTMWHQKTPPSSRKRERGERGGGGEASEDHIIRCNLGGVLHGEGYKRGVDLPPSISSPTTTLLFTSLQHHHHHHHYYYLYFQQVSLSLFLNSKCWQKITCNIFMVSKNILSFFC